jgi:hypothetical protein
MAFAPHYFPHSYFAGRYFPPLADAQQGASEIVRKPNTATGAGSSWNDFIKTQPTPPLALLDEAEAIALVMLLTT